MSDYLDEIKETQLRYYCFIIPTVDKLKQFTKEIKSTEYCILQVNFYGYYQVIVGLKEKHKSILNLHSIFLQFCLSKKYIAFYWITDKKIIVVFNQKSSKIKAFFVANKEDKIQKIITKSNKKQFQKYVELFNQAIIKQ